jgi:hypothetical protein
VRHRTCHCGCPIPQPRLPHAPCSRTIVPCKCRMMGGEPISAVRAQGRAGQWHGLGCILGVARRVCYSQRGPTPQLTHRRPSAVTSPSTTPQAPPKTRAPRARLTAPRTAAQPQRHPRGLMHNSSLQHAHTCSAQGDHSKHLRHPRASPLSPRSPRALRAAPPLGAPGYAVWGVNIGAA